jgi:hypothetical protein
VAGNPEPLRHTTLTLTDVSAITAISPPQITGTPTLGSHLQSTTGSWNMQGLTFTRQWLRDGKTIAGATGASYVVRGADIGHRLSVRVTASKPGKTSGTSTSAETAVVAKATSQASVKVSRTMVADGGRVTATAVLTSPVAATGRVKVFVGGSAVAKLTLHGGHATTKIRLHGRGKHAIRVRYLGSATVATSTSAKVLVRVR